jgi:hypothetical protein
MKKISSYLFLFFVSLYSLSCSLVDHQLEPKVDVYIAGYARDNNNNRVIAQYWKNDHSVELMSAPSTNSLQAVSIAASGNDIHVVGEIRDNIGVSTALYWKNGVLTNSWKNLDPASLTDIAISGSDIYITGYGVDGSKNTIAAYWKNGEAITLPDKSQSRACGIFISGNDIYLAGIRGNGVGGDKAIYWKNGIPVELGNNEPSRSWANAIAVIGNDVYVAGWRYNSQGLAVARYWKNGVEVTLVDEKRESFAYDIAVSGSDVYICGAAATGALVWKNGVLMDHPQGYEATGVAVANGNLYVAGTLRNDAQGTAAAKYWKNGNSVSLPNTPGVNGTSKIFVTNQ